MSAESQTFGKLIVRLRGKTSQTQLASRMRISRSAVANAESGRLPGRGFVDALVRVFSDEKAEIERVFSDAVEAEGRKPRPVKPKAMPPDSVFLRRVKGLQNQGRLVEAEAALRAALADATEPAEVVRGYELLGRTYYNAGNNEKGVETYRVAIRLARNASLKDKEVQLRQALAGRLMRGDRFAEALAVVDEGLAALAFDGVLWRRRGAILWYAHDFPGAYAALTTSLHYGMDRMRVFHARGSVLAEWGHFAEAITELDEVIAYPASPMAQATARNARAVAYAGLEKTDLALQEWAELEEIIPESGWLHYFRAKCYEAMGESEKATAGFKRALECQGPGLNEGKRTDAKARSVALSP